MTHAVLRYDTQTPMPSVSHCQHYAFHRSLSLSLSPFATGISAAGAGLSTQPITAQQQLQSTAAPCTERLRQPEHRRTHRHIRSEEHTSELQSLMRISYAVFCLIKKTS